MWHRFGIDVPGKIGYFWKESMRNHATIKSVKSGGFESFANRMTVAIAMASGGGAVGTFFGGTTGAVIAGIICAIFGFLAGDVHDKQPHTSNG